MPGVAVSVTSMNELFGIPLDTLLVVLAVGLGIALGVLAVLALRNPVLVRLGVRNFGRRRGADARSSSSG